MYQLNPLLIQESNPYYNGRRTMLAAGSALTTAVGANLIKSNNQQYQLIHIISCIYECNNINELRECCNHYKINDIFDDHYDSYKYHDISFKELQERIVEDIKQKLKQMKIAKRVGIGLTALGGTGLAATVPKEARAWKWAFSH